jgi:glucose-6-phosphate 1-epimerase
MRTFRRRRIRTEKHNSRTTVVWNPWRDGAKALADLGDYEWRGFTCVEASNIMAYAVELGPGEEHVMGAVLKLASSL